MREIVIGPHAGFVLVVQVEGVSGMFEHPEVRGLFAHLAGAEVLGRAGAADAIGDEQAGVFLLGEMMGERTALDG